MTARPVRERRTGLVPWRGFTIVEIAVVFGLIGVLSSVSISAYLGYVEKARVTKAIAEIAGIATVIDALVADGETPYPDSLADIDVNPFLVDPWGKPYQYLNLQNIKLPGGGGGGKGNGKKSAGIESGLPHVRAPPGGLTRPRKDRFLVPVNTDYDLYSSGPDGQSVREFSAKKSRDDIVRAGNGAYIGIAEYY